MNKKQINHIAFIMDGNGRWATSKNLKRIDGHEEGVNVIPKIIQECINQKIKYASFFCFSTENWKRPKTEVAFLIKKIATSLSKKNLNWFLDRGIKVNLIGFESNMPIKILNKILNFCKSTSDQKVLTVNFYFNYGSQQEILNACQLLIDNKEKATKENFEKYLLTKSMPDVDLLIRTSGEKRISNFLLWQIAYAEIIFEPTLWPDYSPEKLRDNIQEYNNRHRRFGGIDA